MEKVSKLIPVLRVNPTVCREAGGTGVVVLTGRVVVLCHQHRSECSWFEYMLSISSRTLNSGQKGKIYSTRSEQNDTD